MDFLVELKYINQQLSSGDIDENEYNKRKRSILDKFIDGSSSVAVNIPKEMDLYAILKLNSNATRVEIKSSFKKLALKHHPDKNAGTETEEWNKISKAYQTLSDQDSRLLYDNYGSLDDSLASKTSFNLNVGGDPWKPYIGDLEIGLWLFSFIYDELGKIASAEQKEYRHSIRINSITCFLQDKLSQFPNNPSNDETFMKTLRQDALILSMEPNGKELLSNLGKIYTSKASPNGFFMSLFSVLGWFTKPKIKSEMDQEEYSVSKTKADPSRSFMATILNMCCRCWNSTRFIVVDFIPGFLAIKIKGESKLNQEEIDNLFWRLARSEINSIARESCDKVLNNENLAESLYLLGKVWLEASKQP